MTQFIKLTYVASDAEFNINVARIATFRAPAEIEVGRGVGCVLYVGDSNAAVEVKESYKDVMGRINVANQRER